MVEEAEKYAQQDQELKEKIEARNSLENYAHLLKGQLNDKSETGLGSKLEDDDRETLDDAIKETLEFIEDNFDTATAEEFEEQNKN